MSSSVLQIDTSRFNDSSKIEQRIQAADPEHHGALRTALNYLYLDNGPVNLMPSRRKIAELYLEPAELILVRWLTTRTNGSGRKKYGSEALRAARSSRYKCKACDFSDVRALNLDHVNGRDDKTIFACLCANCHSIKSRASDWSGKKRETITP